MRSIGRFVRGFSSARCPAQAVRDAAERGDVATVEKLIEIANSSTKECSSNLLRAPDAPEVKEEVIKFDVDSKIVWQAAVEGGLIRHPRSAVEWLDKSISASFAPDTSIQHNVAVELAKNGDARAAGSIISRLLSHNETAPDVIQRGTYAHLTLASAKRKDRRGTEKWLQAALDAPIQEGVECTEEINSGVSDEVLFNKLITASARAVDHPNAIKYLSQALQANVTIEDATYTSLLVAATRASDAESTINHLQVLENRKVDISNSMYAAAFDVFANANKAFSAEHCLEKLKEQGVAVTQPRYVAVIKALAEGGDPKLAEQWIEESPFDLHVNAYVPVVKGYGATGMPGRAAQLVERMIINGLDVNRNVFDPVVAAFAAEGQIEHAKHWIKRGETANVWQNHGMRLAMHNTVIKALVDNSDHSRANEWFEMMKEMKCTPDTNTNEQMVLVYTRKGDMGRAQRWLNTMYRMEMTPGAHLYLEVAGVLISKDRLQDANVWLNYLTRDMVAPQIKNVSKVFNELISGYLSKNTLAGLQRAADAFAKGKELNLNMSHELFPPFMTAVRDRGSIEIGTQVMKWMDETKDVEFTTNMFNDMIEACARQKDLTGAVHWFRQISAKNLEPDVMSFSGVISGCCHTFDIPRAERWLRRLVKAGFEPTAGVFEHIIRAASKMKDDELVKIWFNKARDMGVEPSAASVAAALMGASRNAREETEEASRLWQQLRASGARPDVRFFNMLINSHAHQGDTQAAEHWFDKIYEERLAPDMQSYYALLTSFAKGRDPLGGQRWLKRMEKNSIEPDENCYRQVILAATTSGKIDEALKTIHKMSTVGLHPSAMIYSSIMNAYANSRDPRGAITWFNRMQEAGCEPDMINYTAVIRAHSKIGDGRGASQWLDNMLNARVEADLITYTTVAGAYAVAGNGAGAQSVLDRMQQQLVDPDVMAYNQLLMAYGKQGETSKCIEILSKMRLMRMTPNQISYHNVLGAFAKKGDLANAKDMLNKLHAEGFKNDRITCINMIEANARAGNLAEIDSWLGKLHKLNGKPTVTNFAFILEACAEQGEAEEAARYFHVLEREWGLEANGRHVAAVVRAHVKADQIEGAAKYLLRLRSITAVNNRYSKSRRTYPEDLVDVSAVFGEVIMGFARDGKCDRAGEWLQCMFDEDVRDIDNKPPSSTLLLRLHAAVVESCLGLEPGQAPDFSELSLPKRNASERIKTGMDAIRFIEKMVDMNLIPPVPSAEERFEQLCGGVVEQLSGAWLEVIEPKYRDGDDVAKGVEDGHHAIVNAISFLTKMVHRWRINTGITGNQPIKQLLKERFAAASERSTRAGGEGSDLLEEAVFAKLEMLPAPKASELRKRRQEVTKEADVKKEEVIDRSVPSWKRTRRGTERVKSERNRDQILEKKGNIVFTVE